MDLSNITSDDGRGEKASCDRCAGCCTGGGPVLRQADAHLIRSGKLLSTFLYTIRKGELLFDKDKMKMIPVKTDLIKIKVDKDNFECLFLQDSSNCDIYTTRPVECRAFKCWNTREIENKYNEDPLERADILSDVEGLWGLIDDHQARCSYDRMGELTSKLAQDDNDAVMSEINEIINYDNALRETMVEKANIDPEMLHFLIGRPFTETMVMFNLKIENKDGGYILFPIS